MSDNTVKIVILNESARKRNETDDEFYSRVVSKVPDFSPVDHTDIEQSSLPLRADRHRWRWREVGGRKEVFVDETIPPVPIVKAPRP